MNHEKPEKNHPTSHNKHFFVSRKDASIPEIHRKDSYLRFFSLRETQIVVNSYEQMAYIASNIIAQRKKVDLRTFAFFASLRAIKVCLHGMVSAFSCLLCFSW